MLARVLVEYPLGVEDKYFDYIIPESLNIKVGNKVLIPFSTQIIEGFVMSIHNNYSNYEYKEIKKILDKEFIINKELLYLGKIMSKMTISPLITCYQAMFPSSFKAGNKTNINKKYETYVYLNKKNIVDKYISLKKRTSSQLDIINLLSNNKKVLKSSIKSNSLKTLINNNIVLEHKKEIFRKVYINQEEYKNIKLSLNQKKSIEEIINSDNKNILLYGVNGSGKTEVYINLIKKIIKQGKTAIYLVPEISLTPQVISRLSFEFKNSIAILHSRLSEGEKYDEYRKIVSGKVKIVVGARSAIFAPLNNLGLIIIDECSSSSYKQDTTPKYNAIDIALERGKYNNAYVVMGSATPLLEQYARSRKGIFKLVMLKERFNKILPKIHIVNMSEEVKVGNNILSKLLKEKIKDRLQKKEQIILFLNRRGFSTYISCSSCGYVYKCPNCDITLTYHKTNETLMCHYCGYTKYLNNKCPNCGEENLTNLGMGTEKLEEYLKKIFPESKILRMDADSTQNKYSYENIIKEFKDKKYDILVGTQMISKGLNFPYVTLVGIINADASLYIPDFRSSERTFEMLLQTGGRSGRNKIPGEVIIQTYNPENYVMESLKLQDYDNFYFKEMNIRRKLKYPPYYYLVQIKISSKKYEDAKRESLKIKNYIVDNLNENFIVLGPSTANISKFKNKYYFGILIKYREEENLYEVLTDIKQNKKVTVDVDINPLSTF